MDGSLHAQSCTKTLFRHLVVISADSKNLHGLRFVRMHTIGSLAIDGTSISYRKRKCVVNGTLLKFLSDTFGLCFIPCPQVRSSLQFTSIDPCDSSGVSGLTFSLPFFPSLTITCTLNENVVLSTCSRKVHSDLLRVEDVLWYPISLFLINS